VVLRDGLDEVAKRKIPCPCRESNPGPPARNLVDVLTELLRPSCYKFEKFALQMYTENMSFK